MKFKDLCLKIDDSVYDILKDEPKKVQIEVLKLLAQVIASHIEIKL